jgi:membrane-associated phospholipid phosphatase
MDGLITFIAKYFILIPIFVIAYVFFNFKGGKRREMLVVLFCTAVLSIIFAKIGAHVFDNPRPYISDGTTPLFSHSGDPNGFPSDHTLLSAALAFVVLYFSKRLGIFLLIAAALVGWARVAAHVHHAVDIIGSMAIAGLAYLIVMSALKNNRVSGFLSLKEHKEDK